MATLTLRNQKGAPLTYTEVDNNFLNLNTDITNHIGSVGTGHGVATTSVNGFMSSTDKQKLDALGTDAGMVSDDITTNSIRYPTFTNVTSGSASIYTSSTKLSYNPSSGQLNAVMFNSTSDLRLKSDINDISGALNTVNRISGKTYKLSENGLYSSGIIAQDLQKIIPNSVTDRGDGFLSINYDSLIPYLVEAVKELSGQVVVLSDRIKELENK